MYNTPPTYTQELTAQEKELLAQLLSFQAGYPINSDMTWLQAQANLLSTFPPNLLRSKALLPRLRSIALPFSSSKAKLCFTHKALNAPLIHNTFLEVTAECSAQLERFLEFFENDLQLPQDLKTLIRAQQPFVRRMQAVNGLWMTSKFHRTLFAPLHATPTDFCFERIDSGCEACILASIGGNHVVLSDLRASVCGRKKRGRPHARLLEMVNAWINWTGCGEQIREESDKLGKEIAKCRREMQKIRRLKRRGLDDLVFKQDHELLEEENENLQKVSGSVKEGAEKQEDDEHDFEGSIIDFYAKRMSNASPVNRVRSADGLHEPLRESIVRDPISGKFHRLGPEAQSFNDKKSYTESAYSVHSSERYAASYQNLLAMIKQDDADFDSEGTDLSFLMAEKHLFDFI